MTELGTYRVVEEVEEVPREAAGPAGVRPQDDLYGFVNDEWIGRYVLPAHRTEATMLSLLAEKVQDDVAVVIQAAMRGEAEAGEADPDPAAARQIRDLWTSFMDQDQIERDGTSQYRADLARIAADSDKAQLAATLGRLQASGVAGIADVTVVHDPRRAGRNVLAFAVGSLGLPAPSMYTDDRQSGLRGDYLEHVASHLCRVGQTPDVAAASARTVLSLDTDFAGRLQAAELSDDSGVPTTVAELAGRNRGFAWAVWLSAFGEVPDTAAVQIRHPALPSVLEDWWSAHDLESLRTWVGWRYLHEMAPFGPRAMFLDNFRFYGQQLNGFTTPRPRSLRAMSLVETFLGDAVGERYVARYLPAGTVDGVRRLVGRLVTSYRRHLESADWMHESTRGSALRKLDRMTFEIGGPRTPSSYQGFDVDSSDLLGNVKRGRSWQTAQALARLDRPVDRSAWQVHPHQVTAYYRNSLNHVVIPAAILQDPLYSADGALAITFARLGSVIAHEMSHAFDSLGSHYDELGRLRDWWTSQDRAEFARRAALLVGQYDGFESADCPGRQVDGRRTLAENIADVVGLGVAQAAYADVLAETEPAGGASGAHDAEMRRFLRNWASMWRSRQTPRWAAQQLANDRHAPARFRCNGVVGHLVAFYPAFGVTPDDELYLPPERRFSLWS